MALADDLTSVLRDAVENHDPDGCLQWYADSLCIDCDADEFWRLIRDTIASWRITENTPPAGIDTTSTNVLDCSPSGSAVLRTAPDPLPETTGEHVSYQIILKTHEGHTSIESISGDVPEGLHTLSGHQDDNHASVSVSHRDTAHNTTVEANAGRSHPHPAARRVHTPQSHHAPAREHVASPEHEGHTHPH